MTQDRAYWRSFVTAVLNSLIEYEFLHMLVLHTNLLTRFPDTTLHSKFRNPNLNRISRKLFVGSQCNSTWSYGQPGGWVSKTFHLVHPSNWWEGSEDGTVADAKLLSPHPRLISLRIRITGPPRHWSSGLSFSQCNSDTWASRGH
jgi:hypothetical protein